MRDEETRLMILTVAIAWVSVLIVALLFVFFSN